MDSNFSEHFDADEIKRYLISIREKTERSYINDVDYSGGGNGRIFLSRGDVLKVVRISPASRIYVEREINVLRNILNCPFIIAYKRHEFGDDSNLKIYMELCELGDVGTLAGLFNQLGTPLGIRFMIKMLKDMILALFVLEKKKILHRDIKLSNIFMKGKQRILSICGKAHKFLDIQFLLGDFGWAKFEDSLSNTSFGTPNRWPPECNNNPLSYTFKSEIHCLGSAIDELIQNKENIDSEFIALIDGMKRENPEERPGLQDLFDELLNIEGKLQLKKMKEINNIYLNTINNECKKEPIFNYNNVKSEMDGKMKDLLEVDFNSWTSNNINNISFE